MTEDDARGWIASEFGPASIAPLQTVIDLIRDEAPRQNLVSASSLEAIWARHIVDSAQLLAHQSGDGLWIDVGTGAGFPGVITALLSGRRTLLVEPRRRRVEFLQRLIYTLNLGRQVEVRQARIETISDCASTLSARAVASVCNLLEATIQCTNEATQWVLPKGRNAVEEVAQAEKAWHGTFHVKHSITDPESMIVVASGVSHR